MPVWYLAPIPFFIELLYPQIEQFEHRILVGELTFLRDLAEAEVYALDRVRRVHDLAHGIAVRKQLLNMREMLLPYRHGARVSRPVFAKRIECYDKTR